GGRVVVVRARGVGGRGRGGGNLGRREQPDVAARGGHRRFWLDLGRGRFRLHRLRNGWRGSHGLGGGGLRGGGLRHHGFGSHARHGCPLRCHGFGRNGFGSRGFGSPPFPGHHL